MRGKGSCRVGQNRIYTYIHTIYLISKPKIPYVHRIFMVLANPRYVYGWPKNERKHENKRWTRGLISLV